LAVTANKVDVQPITHVNALWRARNDARTTTERGGYGSRPYMQFLVFGLGTGAGGSRAACENDSKLKPL